jgi:hypothetical protein
MGTLTRKFANNFTVGGVYKPAAINNASLSNVTDIPAAAKGKLTLISSQTASASASISFTSGIDSTYHTYVFKFVNMHPSVDGGVWQVNFKDGGVSYDVIKTTTSFRTYHNEADTDTTLGYYSAGDLAQSTSAQRIAGAGIGADNDQSVSGILHLFNPSSTTYVKHFLIDSNAYADSNYVTRTLVAGYCNTTSAINGIQFSFASGNIDAGTIYMYGVGA